MDVPRLVFLIFNMLNFLYALLLLLFLSATHANKPSVTIVTAYWDIGRGSMESQFKRSNNYYWGYFEMLLKIEANLIIFGDSTLEKIVKQKRTHNSTIFVLRDLSQFHQLWHTKLIHKILKGFKGRPDWHQLWKYPQYGLDMYNPVVMAKLFLMTEALDIDTFNSDFFVWADGGLLHNYDKFGHLYKKDSVLEMQQHFSQISWYFHIYQDESIFRGYRQGEKPYLNESVLFNRVVWANYFGGRIQMVSTLTSIYENFLRITLENGDMGTDQSIFTIMLIRYPYVISVVSDFELIYLKECIRIQSTQHYQTNENHRLFKIKKDWSLQVEFLKQFRNKGNQSRRYLLINNSIIYISNLSLSQYQQGSDKILAASNILSIPHILQQIINKYKNVLLHRLIFTISLITLFYYIARLTHKVKKSTIYL